MGIRFGSASHNYKNKKLIPFIMCLGLHCFDNKLDLRKLAMDLRIGVRELERVARGLGLNVSA